MSDRLRVGVVCAYYLPRNNAPTVRLRYFVEHLAQRHDVHVLTADAGRPMADIRITRWPSFAQQNQKSALHRMATDALFGLRVILHLCRHRYDVLVVSSPVFLASSAVTRFARWRNMPVVLDVRDIYPEVFASAGKLKPESILYRWFDRMADRMYRSSAAIVSVTEGLCESIQKRLGPDTDVHLIRNGFPGELVGLRADKHERFTAVFHGTIGAFQDVDGLLALAAALEPEQIDLVVIGKGSRDQALRDATLPNLRYLGALSFEETMQEVAAAHVGVSLRTADPISRAAFPVKLFEYMAFGLPTITTPVSEAGSFLESRGMGRQFESDDIATLTQTIVRWRDEPESYALAQSAIGTHRDEMRREHQAERFGVLVEAAGRGS
ncbi:MAG: glycosyltransferase family 4 protein [Gammaproteobacteria bacterium]